jgi:hypothetical protein
MPRVRNGLCAVSTYPASYRIFVSAGEPAAELERGNAKSGWKLLDSAELLMNTREGVPGG